MPKRTKPVSVPRPCNVKPSTIFTGDNLPILRGMESNCVDLIYLDPPFNSKHNYAAPIGSAAAGAEFKDTWTLNDIKEEWHHEIAELNPALYHLLLTARLTAGKSMLSYLIYMAVRLIELQRILKDTGSIYLHCDTTASHYLKLMLDSIFGHKNFRNEISWRRTEGSKSNKKRFGNCTDQLLFYVKSPQTNLTEQRLPFASTTGKPPKNYVKDEHGRYYRRIDIVAEPSLGGSSPMYTYKGFTPTTRWRISKAKLQQLDKEGKLVFSKTGRPYRKQYLDEHPGTPLTNFWDDIKGAGHMPVVERTNYPTQKPLALLRRIIEASSKENDLILDPFCGCATACVAAQDTNRKWIGIDIAKKAAELIKLRFTKELNLLSPNIIYRTDKPTRKAKRTKDIKTILYTKQRGNCLGCGTHFAIRNLQLDHIVPLADGGLDDNANLQLLCGHCNSTKGARPMEYLKARLKQLRIIED